MILLATEDDVFIRDDAGIVIHDTLSARDVNGVAALLPSPQHIDPLFTDAHLKTVVLGGMYLHTMRSSSGCFCVS